MTTQQDIQKAFDDWMAGKITREEFMNIIYDYWKTGSQTQTSPQNVESVAQDIVKRGTGEYIIKTKDNKYYKYGYDPNKGFGWLYLGKDLNLKPDYELESWEELSELNAHIQQYLKERPHETHEPSTKEYIVRGWKNGEMVEYKAKSEEEAWVREKMLRDQGYTVSVIRPGRVDWRYGSRQNMEKEHPELKEILENPNVNIVDVKTTDKGLEIKYTVKSKPKQTKQPKQQNQLKPSTPNQPKTPTEGLIGGDAGLRVAASNSKTKERITLPTNPATTPLKTEEIRQPSVLDELNAKAVDIMYKADQTANPLQRAIYGVELAGIGFVQGLGNVFHGVKQIAQEATKNPIEAFKHAVFGTIDWFKSIPWKLEAAFTESPYYAGILAGEVAGGEILGEAGRVAVKPLPKPSFAKVRVLEGGGAEPKLKTVRYGITIQALEKPLLTIAKTDEGVKVGRVLPAPKEAIKGKTVTAYSPLETEFFKKTVETHAESPVYTKVFDLGYDIAKTIYETKEPVIKPKEFSVLSENIPEPAKPAVEKAIKEYEGDIEVYGSVSQKLQMGEYMTRQPKDIEVVVDKPEKFVEKVTKELDKAGVEYTVKGSEDKPKIYFKTDKGEVKGIEVFKKGSEAKIGYESRSDIAYGFEAQRPLKVEGVKMLRLSEQAARKLEGGHVFKKGKILPKHEGRFKDINDLIEIGTAYALEKGLRELENPLVEYAKLVNELYGEEIKSPVAKFIAEKGRLPTREEFKELVKQTPEEMVEKEKELLFKREGESPISYIKAKASERAFSNIILANKASYEQYSTMRRLESEITKSILSTIEERSSPVVRTTFESRKESIILNAEKASKRFDRLISSPIKTVIRRRSELSLPTERFEDIFSSFYSEFSKANDFVSSIMRDMGVETSSFTPKTQEKNSPIPSSRSKKLKRAYSLLSNVKPPTSSPSVFNIQYTSPPSTPSINQLSVISPPNRELSSLKTPEFSISLNMPQPATQVTKTFDDLLFMKKGGLKKGKKINPVAENPLKVVANANKAINNMFNILFK